MKYLQILEVIRSLPEQDQKKIIDELTGKAMTHDYISIRREMILNKQVGCPYCTSIKFFYCYVYVHDYLRFLCKECKKTFTEFIGTWVTEEKACK